MAHGTGDPLIAIKRAIDSRDVLRRLGLDVSWHQYNMPHSVSMDELKDLSQWLIRRL
jgi:phospholipase/carboxylesterase